ncbi:hypothetical protein [Streptomyces jumonjinensis]|uniref:Uncharacterized protein n=1 Tax=Streptomyces jumonjinensis TaxID=1945 RepID=A0A646KLR4_STRJU|nr:hypothetical protein [Streptomyces jumonjinensis]MQT03155.1 hypothetical protein [Streptomyces jumonjinensis]
MTTKTATLLVDRSTSRCSNCGKGAFPQDSHHTRISGYSAKAPCGAKFVAIKSEHSLVTPDRLRGIRPDLPLA